MLSGLRLPDGARVAAAAGVFLLMTVVWAAPVSLAPATTIPDVGDPLHLSYVMAWDAHQIVRRPWALYDSNSFHPYGRSLTFGDHLLPEALLVAPINWATGNAVLASNVGVVLALTLSAFTMFLLVRHLTGSWAAGLLSGLIYAFNSFTRHELLRIHVLNLQWWPLALLFLDRFARSGRARDARLLAATLVLQGLSGAYYLICTALVAPLWLVVGLLAAARKPTLRDARVLATALVLAALPAALILWPYVDQLRSMGFEKPLVDGPDLLCYVQPPASQVVWGGVRLFGGCFGVTHFLGFGTTALILLGVGLVLARRVLEARPLALAAIATAVAGLALSLGPVVRVGGRALVTGPFALLHAAVPFVRGMDGSRRMGVLVLLGGSILAGLGCAWLLERVRGPFVVCAILAVLLPLEHWTPPAPGFPVPTGGQVPAAYAWLAQQAPEPLIELPLHPEAAKRFRAAYLYFSTYHWRPIPIGRTSFYPPGHDFLAWNLREFPDPISITLLERLGVRTLLVHPLAWEPEERPRRLAALEAEPRLRLVKSFDDVLPGRFADLRLGAERVYQIVGDTPAASLCTPAAELSREGWRLASQRSAERETGAHVATRFERWAWHREWRRPWVVDWARDGDRRTAWMTEDGQAAGDALEVRWPEPETVAAIVLDLYYPYDEFPHTLVLIGDRGGDARARLAYADGPDERWATLGSLLARPREARLVLRLDEPRLLSSLTLKLGAREQDAAWPRWAVPELHVYRDCR